jgi:hypothetical protein
LVSLANNKCLCRIRLLLRQSIALQPLIEPEITAIEPISEMLPGEDNRRQIRFCFSHVPKSPVLQ